MDHRPLLASLTLLLTFFGSARVASACQCGSLPSVAEDRARSTAVFDAEIAGARIEGGSYVADARVTRVWHGNPPSSLTITMTDCPPSVIDFGPGGPSASGTWLVYAYEAGARWAPTACGRSRRYPAASEDAAELASAPAVPTTSEPRRQGACGCAAGGARRSGALCAMGALAVLAHRRRAR